MSRDSLLRAGVRRQSTPKPRKGVRVSRRTAGSPCSGGFPRPRGRARRYCARTAPSRAPRVPLGQVSPHWGRLLACPNDLFPAPMRARVLLPQCAVSYPSAGPRLPRTVGGLVEAPDGPLSRKEEWLGPGLGLFASDVVFSKGSLARWGVARTFPRNPNVSLALGWCGGGLQVKRSFQRDTVTLQVL